MLGAPTYHDVRGQHLAHLLLRLLKFEIYDQYHENSKYTTVITKIQNIRPLSQNSKYTTIITYITIITHAFAHTHTYTQLVLRVPSSS